MCKGTGQSLNQHLVNRKKKGRSVPDQLFFFFPPFWSFQRRKGHGREKERSELNKCKCMNETLLSIPRCLASSVQRGHREIECLIIGINTAVHTYIFHTYFASGEKNNHSSEDLFQPLLVSLFFIQIFCLRVCERWGFFNWKKKLSYIPQLVVPFQMISSIWNVTQPSKHFWYQIVWKCVKTIFSVWNLILVKF